MKIELECQRDQLDPENTASHGNQGVFFTCTALSSSQAIAIFTFVFELEVIDRLEVGKQLRRTPVQTQLKAAARADTHVVITLRAHLGVSFQVGLIENRLAFHAFFPEPLRHAGAVCALILVDAGRQDLINPTHGISQR